MYGDIMGLKEHMKYYSEVYLMLIALCCVFVIMCEDYQRFNHEKSGRISISQSCLENNEFYVMDNIVDGPCVVDIACFGEVDQILIQGNRFSCEGIIQLSFENATKVVVARNHIEHSVRFVEIDEFVFADTPTMDKIIIRGKSL